jgi:ABC-type transport system substrate-binding protein
MGTKLGPQALFRRSVLALSLCGFSLAALAQVPQTAPPPKPGEKVFKYAFLIAETGFDGVQLSDLYSRIVTSNIFEAPLAFHYLDQEKVVPLTAATLPEVTNDFKTWTIRIKPGIFFADDPAFGGKKRELTAADYVYAFKRHYDPKNKSPNLYFLENAKVIGMSEIRKRIMDAKQPFPYDEQAEGIKLIDKYTFQLNFAEPQPRFDQQVLADSSVWGAVAREVVEKYGDKIMEHPVGTGPFMLSAWRRSSKMVLTKNPNYREEFYPKLEGIEADEPRYAEYAKKFAGRKLPMVDRVEVSIIEESQPRWLAFMNKETDMVAIPGEYINIALPNNELAPNLTKAGVKRFTLQRPDVAMSFFNMEHPLVGGYEPHKVALRRAIAMAQDEAERKRAIYRNQAVISQGLIPHATFGFDPTLRTEMSVFDVPKAKALLDTYGYVDKDGDGWRDTPDGKPLVIEYASQPDSTSRQMQELWKKSMDRLGVKITFKIAKWPEQLKNSRAGKLMMWGVGWVGSTPDSDTFLALGFGPNIGGANHARFNLPAYNEIYKKTRVMGDSPERAKLMQEAASLAVAYMPYKIHVHRYETQLTQPWVDGWRFHPYMRDNWKLVDVEMSKRPK